MPRIAAFLLTLVVLLIPYAARADGGYVIDKYDVQIAVDKSSRMAVRETIDVTFLESKRGIFRDILNRYNLPSGPQRRVYISGVTVQGETFVVTQQDNNLDIRIGEEDVWLPAGTHKTYIITYQVAGAINWFKGDSTWDPRTEIYWNVIGSNVNTTIARTTFQISFPTGDKTIAIKPRMYVGGYGTTQYMEPGSADKNATFTAAPGQVKGDIRRTLNPGEAVSVIVAVPEGLILQPPFWETAGDFFRMNWGLLIPVGLAALLGVIWLFIGRDPKLGPAGVRFDPPPGIDPAFAGVLIDDKVDGRDITAGIMAIAVKGIIKFHSGDAHGRFDPETTFIKRTSKTDLSDLTTYERYLFQIIDPGNGEIPIDTMVSKLNTAGYTVTTKLRDRLVNEGYYRIHPEDVRGQMGAIPIFLVFLLFWGGGMFSGVLSHIGLIPSTTSLILGLIACVPVYLFFMYIMPARTPVGAVKHNECVAFYNAMKGRAHYNDWLTKTNLDQIKYEQYLPYAIAFGLTNEWSAICNGVVKTMPSFCESSSPNGWDYYLFTSSLNHSFYSMNSGFHSAITPPSRSSSGDGGGWSGGSGFSDGGGFSGGGFGGGGVGSW